MIKRIVKAVSEKIIPKKDNLSLEQRTNFERIPEPVKSVDELTLDKRGYIAVGKVESGIVYTDPTSSYEFATTQTPYPNNC